MISDLFWIFIGIIFYTYAGYPILLHLFAIIFRKPYPDQPNEPDVTLLIAAYNEEAFISQKLENALSLDYPKDKLHILVAADGSDDRTPELVKTFTDRGVELCYQPIRFGKMAAINRAMEFTRGEIIVFSDANNTYENGTLRALVSPFSDPQVGCVSGAKHIIKGADALSASEGLYWKYESFIKKQETRLGSCSGVSGEILAIRRSLFEPAPKGIINDDFYMAMRILRRGYRIVYSPRAQSFERVSLTAGDEIIRRTRINAGRYQALSIAGQILPVKRPILLWQVLSHKFLRLFIPFAMIGAILTNLAALFPVSSLVPASLMRLSPPFNWIFLALQCVFYMMAWIGIKTKPAGKLGKILYLPAFLVNSNLAALHGFFSYVKGSDQVLWKRARRAEERGKIHE